MSLNYTSAKTENKTENKNKKRDNSIYSRSKKFIPSLYLFALKKSGRLYFKQNPVANHKTPFLNFNTTKTSTNQLSLFIINNEILLRILSIDKIPNVYHKGLILFIAEVFSNGESD